MAFGVPVKHFFQEVDSIRAWEILVMLLSESGGVFISGETQDALVTWKTGKSFLAPSPFSFVTFLTVILPEPDHSASDGKQRLCPQMQRLMEHVQRGQWLFWAKAVVWDLCVQGL